MITFMDGSPQQQSTNQLMTGVNTAPGDAWPENDARFGAAPEFAAAPTRTLEQLGKGEHAIVVDIKASLAFGSLDALVTRRLWELGFLPGASISVVGFGLLKRDPIAVKIGGTKFALRRAEAQKILVKSESNKAAQ